MSSRYAVFQVVPEHPTHPGESPPQAVALVDVGGVHERGTLSTRALLDYWGNAYWLSLTDVPLGASGPRVIARRVVTALQRAGATIHPKPARIHIHRLWTTKRASSPWRPNREPALDGLQTIRIIGDEFVALDITALPVVECANWPKPDEPGMIAILSRDGIVAPAGGFPVAFRVDRNPAVCVSGVGRDAILNAGVRGIGFEPVRVVPSSSR